MEVTDMIIDPFSRFKPENVLLYPEKLGSWTSSFKNQKLVDEFKKIKRVGKSS